jgi:serpin B
MTMNGAANGTFDAMRQTLGFGAAEQQSINEGYKGLIGLLRGLDATTQFEIANSIWYRQTFPFNPAFLTATHSWFDAEVSAQNFTDAAATLANVNGWVKDKTRGKITTILDTVDPYDVMYLINAIYFKGRWRQRFDPADTKDAPFHAADGSTQTARLMYKKDPVPYLATPQFQAVDLPYGNGAFTMTVLLPSAGTNLDTFIASLTRADWDRWMAAFQTTEVMLHLPKLKLAYERQLNDDLTALGMGVAFEAGRADFSRMTASDADRLFISLVLQKAFVDIDEEGTEATAVTVVVIKVTSTQPSQPATMRVDRPFLFLIRERLSGTVLFMGKIVKI